jgi:hypothetical protein
MAIGGVITSWMPSDFSMVKDLHVTGLAWSIYGVSPGAIMIHMKRFMFGRTLHAFIAHKTILQRVWKIYFWKRLSFWG